MKYKINRSKTNTGSHSSAQGIAQTQGKSLAPPGIQLQKKSIQKQSDDGVKKALSAMSHAYAIREAVAGIGTDEEAIFNILRKLSFNETILVKLAYRQMYGVSMMEDLKGDLNDGEMRIALIFMDYFPYAGSIMGSFQADRAWQRLLKISAAELDQYTDILDNLPTLEERNWVHKAFAAQHSIDELRTFALRLKGQDAAWRQNHLRLTASTDSRGVQQQWTMSCNATTAEAAHGEFDPIYALATHDANPNLLQDVGNNAPNNTNLAADQASMLQSNYSGTLGNMSGSTPVARNVGGGSGRWADDLLNQQSAASGVTYTTRRIGANEITLSDAVTAMNAALERGISVPIVVGMSSSGYSHYQLVTRRDGNNYTVHDPGTGQTLTRTADDFNNSTLNIPRVGGYTTLSAIEVPSTP